MNMWAKLDKLPLVDLIKLYAATVDVHIPSELIASRAKLIRAIRQSPTASSNAAGVIANGAASIMRKASEERSSDMARAAKEEKKAAPKPRVAAKRAKELEAKIAAENAGKKPARRGAKTPEPEPKRGRGKKVEEAPAPAPKRGAKGKTNGEAFDIRKAAAAGGRPRTGVGATIRSIIKDDPEKSNKDVAAEALEEHPDSSTNAQCVAWYRNDMRKKGEIE